MAENQDQKDGNTTLDSVAKALEEVKPASAAPQVKDNHAAEVQAEEKAEDVQYKREVEREERKQRHWIVRVLVLCMVTIAIIVVGSIAYVYAVKGGNFEGSAIDSMMKNLIEVLKLFGNSPGNTH